MLRKEQWLSEQMRVTGLEKRAAGSKASTLITSVVAAWHRASVQAVPSSARGRSP